MRSFSNPAMSSLPVYLAPLTLLLPGPLAVSDQQSEAGLLPREALADPAPSTEPGRWLTLESMEDASVNQQVRIERRVTIRISPDVPANARSLFADQSRRDRPTRIVERKTGKCVPIRSIAGVQPTRDNRLTLYLHDQRILSASLEKTCNSRDFYSGFYVDKNSDGLLCIDRDKLHSRTGAKCEVHRMRQLVAE